MLNYILYRIGQFIALATPLRLSYWIAVFVSDLHYMFARQDRLAVTNNLKVIFPEKSEKEIARIRIKVFRNFAKYLVDFFRFSKIDKEYIKKNIKIDNIAYINEALSCGKGVIVLSAHIGNWELGGVVVALSGYPIWVVALTHKQKKVNDFFNAQRKSKNVSVIPVGRAVRQCLNVLNENKLIALVGDRDFSQRGAVIDFFGKPTILPEGPAAISLKTQAVIVPGFMFRNDDDTFTLRFEKPVEFTPTLDKQKDIKALMLQYKTIIEDYIRQFPDQWYMFKKFWVD